MFDMAIYFVLDMRPPAYTILGAHVAPTNPSELRLFGRDPDGDDWQGAVALPLPGCRPEVAEKLLASTVSLFWRLISAARPLKGGRVSVDGRGLTELPLVGQRLGGIVDHVDRRAQRFELILWPEATTRENPPRGT